MNSAKAGRESLKPVVSNRRRQEEHPVHLRAGSRKPLPNNIRKLAIDVCADKDFLQQELESEFRPGTKVNALAMTTLGEEDWLIFNKASNSYLLYENANVEADDCISGDQVDVKAKPW